MNEPMGSGRDRGLVLKMVTEAYGSLELRNYKVQNMYDEGHHGAKCAQGSPNKGTNKTKFEFVYMRAVVITDEKTNLSGPVNCCPNST